MSEIREKFLKRERGSAWFLTHKFSLTIIFGWKRRRGM